MQSILENLQAVTGADLGFKVGLGLAGILGLQALLMLGGTVRQLYFDGRQRRADRQRLNLLIQAAALQCQEAEQARFVWNGFRKFTVQRKVRECDDVYSYYLVAHDGKPLPAFKPGQYLTFQLNIPGVPKPVIRCYSLSDGPHEPGVYRVTIKRGLPPTDQPNAPHGVASSYFCDVIKEGDILDVKTPGGHFTLNLGHETPVVLISGGVGITPMLSMVNAIVASGSKREVWFFFGARNRSEHIQKEHLEQLATRHDNVRLCVCYSRPAPNDVPGRDYHQTGRVTVELLQQLLPSKNHDYFICGPGPFMKSITDGLRDWGVPDKNVFFEAFGPATIKKAASEAPADKAAAALEVTFGRSGKSCRWTPAQGTLLELAEANGVTIEAGCRAGNCGTCVVAIKSGDVDYLAGHGATAEDRSCLACICQPKSNLILDA